MSTNIKNPSKPSEKTLSMIGADLLVEALIREGVEHVFAYPGGASMEMHQSLVKRKSEDLISSKRGTMRTRGKMKTCMTPTVVRSSHITATSVGNGVIYVQMHSEAEALNQPYHR